MVRTLRPLPFLAAAALLTACQGARPAEPAAAGVAGPVRMVHHQGAAGSPQAVASGVLRVDPHGCLRLNDRMLAWPAEAALDLSQPGVVRVFRRDEAVSVQVGESVALLVAAPSAATAPAACPGPQWAVTRFAPGA